MTEVNPQTRPDAMPYLAAPLQPTAKPPWSAGRVTALVIGSIVALVSLGMLASGLAALFIDQTQRDSAGFVSTGSVELESNGYAIVAAGLRVDTQVPGWLQVSDVLGDIRLQAESVDGSPLFVGVAREQDVAAYVDAIGHDEVNRVSGDEVTYRPHPGQAPPSAPTDQDIWTEWTAGPGLQTLTVEPESGRWVAVGMNADGSAEVHVTASVAAELPVLPRAAVTLLIAGAAGLLISAVPIFLAVRR